MRNILLVVLFALMNLSATFAQNWQTDFTTAKEIASQENKPIVLVFQGSDWCAPCIKLDLEIWSTDTFKAYAKDNYVMLQADFPRKKKNALSETQSKANAKLAETYNQEGMFPLVVILDKKGNVLGKTSYKKTTPKDYIEEINKFIK